MKEPVWGRGNPESDLHPLPDVTGPDAIELGCGLDNSSNQLATARMLQGKLGLRFPLVHASAERAQFADASFDFAISRYGAAVWCDPYGCIPEA